MKLPKPHPIGYIAKSEEFYTHKQLIQALKDCIEECMDMYSPDDSAHDWMDKMREKLKELDK